MSGSTAGGGKVSVTLVSPIVLAIPIILVTALAGKFDLSAVPPVFAIGVGVMYFISTGFYVNLRRGGRTKAAVAVGLVIDGALLIFFSSAFGSGIALSFIGFVVAIAGIAAGISATSAPGVSMFARKIDSILPDNMSLDELRKIIESIQFPCVFMERGEGDEEIVVACNQQFADTFGLKRGKILGSSLGELLPIEFGKSQFSVGGEEWVMKRTAKGKQVLVTMSQVIRTKEETKLEVFDAIDPATGLYAAGFMKYKAKADVESANRGKRRMSVVFFKLSYPPGAAVGVSDDELRLASVIMGRVILQSIRICDSAYRMADDEVLLLMPDTPKAGSKVVISRIYAMLKRTSAVECPSLSRAIMDCVDRDYVGGTDLPPYDKLPGELSTLFYRKYPELARDITH
jgi:PAS domain-containing protein